ncbi:MAG: PEGA domain-containing protein [Methanoregula sp.]
MNQKIDRKIVFSILICYILISGCISGQESEKGTLHITSSPSGAEIYIDNQFQGSTPCTVSNVEQGNHTLEFRYSGYLSRSMGISVSPGESNYYAALLPQPDNQGSAEKTPLTTTSPSKVTVQASKNTMILGDSILFSGTSVGSDSVILTLYGPGYYSNGVLLDRLKVNSVGSWSYTWNRGFSIQSGSYTLVVEDAQKTTSGSVKFSVVGGGEVSIAANSYAAARGETITFSGRCTTGAQNVLLVLYGPERFSGGVELGSLSVLADKTWNFMYTLDNSMPTGSYTMYVYDIPKTSSSTTQFTVGFTS